MARCMAASATGEHAELLNPKESKPEQSGPRSAASGNWPRRVAAALVGAGVAGGALACLAAKRVMASPGVRGALRGLITEDEVCHDPAPGEKCHDAVSWVMTEGIYGHPEWYAGLNYSARFEEFQAALHKQDPTNCPSPCKNPAAAKRTPGIPGSALDLPKPQPERKPVSFYMYRVQSGSNYPLENVNTANLAGVMWYLHNEIVPSYAIHRKYNISRLLRFKITVEPTWEFYNVHRRLFSEFTAFDNGRCTAPDCMQVYNRYGFLPGCQILDVGRLPYHSSTRTRLDKGCSGIDCHAPVWYALPGPCPQQEFAVKDRRCTAGNPGGRCAPGAALGTRSCTYQVKDAGEVSLDELSGITPSYYDFYMSHNREYDPDTDAGVGTSFWDKRQDAGRCAARIDKVKALFDQKYPGMAPCDALPEPPCDFDAWLPDEFTWPTFPNPLA